MTWRRFLVLLGGLSPQSWWCVWLADQPKRRRIPLSGREVESFFNAL